MQKISILINVLLFGIIFWFLTSDLDDRIYEKITLILKNNTYNSDLVSIKKDAKSRQKFIKLDIGSEHYNMLLATREECLKVGYIGNDVPNPYHPAKITFNDKEYQVKLRFKGDFLDHINDEKKWSFKIKLLNKETIFGMREFAIQRPETRNGFGEYVFHRMLHYNGLLSIPYDFIWVEQNGQDHGLYAYEGRMKKIFSKLMELSVSQF